MRAAVVHRKGRSISNGAGRQLQVLDFVASGRQADGTRCRRSRFRRDHPSGLPVEPLRENPESRRQPWRAGSAQDPVHRLRPAQRPSWGDAAAEAEGHAFNALSMLECGWLLDLHRDSAVLHRSSTPHNDEREGLTAEALQGAVGRPPLPSLVDLAEAHFSAPRPDSHPQRDQKR